MGDLSEHFSRVEFRCHGFGRRGHRDHATPVDRGLVELLELVRADYGKPLAIVSGHRCPWWNAAVGGAGGSQHLLGRAVDIRAGVIRPARAHLLGAHGIGTRGVWAVHLDRRPGPHARWAYD